MIYIFVFILQGIYKVTS